MRFIEIIITILFIDYLFKYEHHRRYCKKCGQRQDLFESYFINKKIWWEDMGSIKIGDVYVINSSLTIDSDKINYYNRNENYEPYYRRTV